MHDPLASIRDKTVPWGEKTVKPGMQDDDEFVQPCLNPEHAPPTMLYIPPGKKYVHVCPACGYTVTLRGSGVTF